MAIILCVEDEPDLRHDIVEELQVAGYVTIEAASGEEALLAVRKHKPDLVLCDDAMPGMSGYRLLTELRQNHPRMADAPFIFLSELADRRNVISGKVSGADDYITKPIDFGMMLATVASHIRQVKRLKASGDRNLLNHSKTASDEDQVEDKERPAQSAARFKKELTDLAEKNSGTIVTGRFQMVGLREIKEELGDLWDKTAQKVYSIAEKTIQKRLSPDDVFTRQEDGFLICFADLNESEASFKREAIEREIREKIVGKNLQTELSNITAEIRTVEISATEAEQSDDLTSLIVAKLDQMTEKIDATAKNTFLDILKTCRLRPREVRTGKGKVSAIMIAAFDKSTATKINSLKTLQGNTAELAADIDELTLSQVAEHVYNGLLPRHSLIVAAVNFSTLDEKRLFKKYLSICRRLTVNVRSSLVLNVTNIPGIILPGRIASTVHSLCTFSRLGMMQITKPELGNIDPILCRAALVAIDFANLEPLLHQNKQKVKELIQQVHQYKARFFVDNIPSIGAAKTVSGLGADLVSLHAPR